VVETAADWAGSLPSARDEAAQNAASNAPQLLHGEVQQATGTSSHLPQWVANDRKVWGDMSSASFQCKHVKGHCITDSCVRCSDHEGVAVIRLSVPCKKHDVGLPRCYGGLATTGRG
jgi:hypothetical protein